LGISPRAIPPAGDLAQVAARFKASFLASFLYLLWFTVRDELMIVDCCCMFGWVLFRG
jgi:hypothetical protein